MAMLTKTLNLLGMPKGVLVGFASHLAIELHQINGVNQVKVVPIFDPASVLLLLVLLVPLVLIVLLLLLLLCAMLPIILHLPPFLLVLLCQCLGF